MAILAIQYPVYKPAMRIISNITNDFPAQVTTTFNHNYITGLVVRLLVPIGYGMVQVNQLSGSIIVTDDTTFTIDIDTRYFSPYTTPASPNDYQYPQTIPFGEVNSSLLSSTFNVLPY